MAATRREILDLADFWEERGDEKEAARLRVSAEQLVCNGCLRDIAPSDDPGNGLCGPCNRLETPESQG